MKNILIVGLILLSGCTSIHFDNGPQTAVAQANENKWHHNFLFSLYEGSDAVDLAAECQQKEWVSVKTELTAANIFSSVIVNFLGPIWYPKTVEVTCQ